MNKRDFEKTILSRVPGTHACVVTDMKLGSFRVDIYDPDEMRLR